MKNVNDLFQLSGHRTNNNFIVTEKFSQFLALELNSSKVCIRFEQIKFKLENDQLVKLKIDVLLVWPNETCFVGDSFFRYNHSSSMTQTFSYIPVQANQTQPSWWLLILLLSVYHFYIKLNVQLSGMRSQSPAKYVLIFQLYKPQILTQTVLQSYEHCLNKMNTKSLTLKISIPIRIIYHFLING